LVGAEVRYYEKGGVTYRETRQVVQRPVAETQMQESTQTVYREQLVTETQKRVRTAWIPVTEYRWEAHWVGRWNPFVDPHLENQLVPYTRWEARSETIDVPVSYRRLVPQTQIVRVPVTTHRTVEEEVITRVAVSGRPSATTTRSLQAGGAPTGQQIGGLAQLENDPPRQGVATAWRPSQSERR
jgi:hypothetical protein